MSDAAVGPYQERNRKPGGKTRVKEIWKVLGLKEEEDVGLLDRSCRPSGRMIFNTITATPDDGESPRRRRRRRSACTLGLYMRCRSCLRVVHVVTTPVQALYIMHRRVVYESVTLLSDNSLGCMKRQGAASHLTCLLSILTRYNPRGLH